MNAKLGFSDIVRYFFVGVCTLLLIVLFLYSNEIVKKDIIDNAKEIVGIDNIIHVAIIVIGIFFVGVITQGIYLLFSTIPRITKFKKVIPSFLLFPPPYLCIQNFCWVLKKQKRINAPSWIFISKNPNKMLTILEGFISQNTSDKVYEEDMRFFNEAFAALSLVTYFLMLGEIFFAIKSLNCAYLIFSISIFVIFVLMSAIFAYRHINKIGYKFLACEKSGKTISKLFDLCGSPVAYVLIRTYYNEDRDNSEYIKEALKSVAMQTYSNIRIIVLEDITKDKEKVTTNTYRIIKEYIEKQEETTGIKDYASRVSYSKKICNGPAGCAYYAREMFLQIASPDDVAIMLDDDDTFRREDSILDIMTQMSRYKADICLTSFQTIEEIGLNICNNGGKTHNDIVRRLSKEASSFAEYITLASSIGWTKSYRYNIIESYNRKILDKKRTININEEPYPYNEYYISLARYEDFPDFLTLLLKKPTPIITGVFEPTHSYRKNNTSLTGNPSLYDFKNTRAKFLAFVLKRVQDNDKGNNIFIEDAMYYALKYVMYKEIQICNILAKYREEGLDGFKNLNPWKFLEYVEDEIKLCNIKTDNFETICNRIVFSEGDVDAEKLRKFNEEKEKISVSSPISKRIIDILEL